METEKQLKPDAPDAPSTELFKPKPGDEALEMSFGSGASFNLLQRVATLLSKSSLVPQIYQNNLPNCIIALNMASRLQADPLMVMQNLYIVHNRPGWSAKFLIATINQSGGFSKLRYEWKGEPKTDDWGCRAWALEKATNERLDGPWITWKMANDEGWVNKNGSKWKTMPVKMFMYRAGAWFVDLYAPELSMGLPTREDLEDMDSLELVETAPGVYGAAPSMPPEDNAGEAGEKTAKNVTEKMKADREAREAKKKPAGESKDETKPADEKPADKPTLPAEEGKKPSAAAPDRAKAIEVIEGLMLKIGNHPNLPQGVIAFDLLQRYGDTRKVAKVPDEKLSATIDGLTQELEELG